MGLAAIGSFAVFVCLIMTITAMQAPQFYIFFVLLCSGFLWLGATVMSRHVFVVLKQHIGKRVGIFEFLSTQFITFLLPFSYRKVKVEVDHFLSQSVTKDDEVW
jgi:hypothetical protein